MAMSTNISPELSTKYNNYRNEEEGEGEEEGQGERGGKGQREGGDDRFEPLRMAIKGGDLNAVKNFLQSHPDEAKQRIDSDQTPLLKALIHAKVNIAEEILNYMSDEDLKITDSDSLTPFILACMRGYLRIVHILITRRQEFVEIQYDGFLPVTIACMFGHRDVTWYLYSRTPSEYLFLDDYDWLLRASTVHKFFDFTLDLFNRLPPICPDGNCKGEKLLLILSKRATIFPSSTHLVFWKCWIYSRIRLQLPSSLQGDVRVPMEQVGQINSSKNLLQVFVRLWSSLSASVKQISGYKEIYDLKLKHCYAMELLRLAFQYIPRTQCISSKIVKEALFKATEHGIVEIFIEVLKRNNMAFAFYNDEGINIMQQVVQHRQGKIFSLVYADGVFKELAICFKDKNNENSFDTAGMLASQTILAQISSPALQMQSELKWFKEVANVNRYLLQGTSGDYIIKDKSQKFTESHKELKGKAEEWYKGIASSSTIVGALIITIMFTAAFTVPGGNKSSTGLPIFLNEWAFKVYIVADAVSLFSSSTSVLTFLGILTARYEEGDFLESLPRQLIIALSSLFISIAAMMTCFCATVVIMLHGDLKLIIPICLLAISPVVAFISLQFPLLKDVFNYTYGSKIFDRKMKLE